jgi:hypothetical protein
MMYSSSTGPINLKNRCDHPSCLERWSVLYNGFRYCADHYEYYLNMKKLERYNDSKGISKDIGTDS